MILKSSFSLFTCNGDERKNEGEGNEKNDTEYNGVVLINILS